MREKLKDSADMQNRITDREQRVEEARKFNLLSNVFMSVALNDKPACQYVLRILTGIDDLVVKEVRGQYRISKIESHDAILDILAEDKAGRLYNMEIQRADTIDHARRTRFYNAMIDSEYLEKGKDYAELPEVYMIYISETDLWKAGYKTYLVEKYFENTNVKYEDGQHILYINAAIDDGSETAKLMKYFRKADPEDMAHGALSKRVHYLKREEGGYNEMCEVADRIYQEGREQGIEQGKLETQKETARNLVEIGFTEDKIAQILNISRSLVRQLLSDGIVPAK